jgi:hypothetical protein
MAVTFTTTLNQAGDKNAAGITIPPEVMAELTPQKRPAVIVTMNGYSYRNTIAVYGNVFMVGLSQEHRNASGIKAGDQVVVTLELDTEPRIIEVPEDLAAALAAKPGAREAFDALATSRRKEFVRQVLEAKAQETRERRIAGIVAKLGES